MCIQKRDISEVHESDDVVLKNAMERTINKCL